MLFSVNLFLDVHKAKSTACKKDLEVGLKDCATMHRTLVKDQHNLSREKRQFLSLPTLVTETSLVGVFMV